MRRLPTLAATFALLTACAGEPARPGPEGGVVIVGLASDAEHLLPPFHTDAPGRIIAELLFDPLAELGPSLNVVGDSAFAPRLARRWQWSRDSLTITFSLDPNARWHDGRPVTATDVRFAFRTLKDPANASPRAADVANLDSVVVVDSLTAAFHFARRYAEQFMHAMRVVPLPAHRLDSIAPGAPLLTHPEIRAPVGSGRFRFVSWERRVRIELAAVEDHYRGRAKPDRVYLVQTGGAGLAQAAAGEIDVWEPITLAEMPTVGSSPHLRVISRPGYFYSFLGLNARDPRDPSKPHPLFGDRALRRALTMAVDREAVRRAAMDSLAVPGLGPFVRAHATADTTIEQIPFDRAAAEAMLDSLGWTSRDPDGTRRRGTQRLAFTVLYPSTATPRARAGATLQEQLRQVGASVTLRGLDGPTVGAEASAGRFDAILWTWLTYPSPTALRGSWMSKSIPDAGATNHWSYSNPAFDRAVIEGIDALDAETRRASLRRAYQLIVDDAPVIWLFESRSVAAVHRRYEMPPWRADAWWLTLSDWTIAPERRLPRDARPAAP